MQKIKFWVVVATVSVMFAGCSLQSGTTTPVTPAALPTSSGSPSSSGAAAKTYTLADISTHKTPQDCWTAINGKVYDMTPMTKSGSHPGGPAINQACGVDGSQLFNTREGRGPHPQSAQQGLQTFYIGDLTQ